MSAAGDKVAMLVFKGRGDENNDLASWSSATDPCSADNFYAGWNSHSGAWVGVTCCADGSWGSRTNGVRCANAGRVTHIGLNSKPGLRGTLEDLTPLSALIHLSLHLCAGISGDVDAVSGLTQLTQLSLAGSNAYGDALKIRRIPALANWGDDDADYTSCYSYRSCPHTAGGHYPPAEAGVLGLGSSEPVVSSRIANPDTHVGAGKCACCGHIPQAEAPATGDCIAALDLTQTLADKAALLSFQGRGDDNGDLSTWSRATEPCRDGWDSRDAGWRHVMCCSSYIGYVCTGSNTARVTYLGLNNKPGVRGNLQDLSAMTALIHLTLSHCNAVSGVANFLGMTQLRELNLYGTRGGPNPPIYSNH